jgi:hypothetical protein
MALNNDALGDGEIHLQVSDFEQKIVVVTHHIRSPGEQRYA